MKSFFSSPESDAVPEFDKKKAVDLYNKTTRVIADMAEEKKERKRNKKGKGKGKVIVTGQKYKGTYFPPFYLSFNNASYL